MLNIKELIKQTKEITLSGLPFMEGKEKLEVEGAIVDTVLTVDEYGYLKGTNEQTGIEEEYVVISLKEYPNNFIYGSSVVTQSFKKLDETMTMEQKAELLEYGLTFKLSKKVSANKRKYTKIEFFPTEG